MHFLQLWGINPRKSLNRNDIACVNTQEFQSSKFNMYYVVKELAIEKWGFGIFGEVGKFELIDFGDVHHWEDMIPIVVVVVTALDFQLSSGQ